RVLRFGNMPKQSTVTKHAVQRKARARQIIARLKREYPDATCALHHSSALELAVATILSAQCTDARVNMVTPHLFAKYRTAADYAVAGGLNLCFQNSGIGNGVVGGRAVFREQMRRNHVDSRVGALRGENRRDDELEGAAMVQRAGRVRVLALQASDDLPRPRLAFGRRDFRLHGLAGI